MNLIKSLKEVWISLFLVVLSIVIIQQRVEFDLQEQLKVQLERGGDPQQIEEGADASFNPCFVPEQPSMDIHPSLGFQSKNWCTHRRDQVDFFLDLVKLMVRTAQSELYDALIAANFRVLYRFAYLRKVDVVLANPTMESDPNPKTGDHDTHFCEYLAADGTKVRKENRFYRVKVVSLNYRTRFTTTVEHFFEGEDACVVQAVFDGFNGK